MNVILTSSLRDTCFYNYKRKIFNEIAQLINIIEMKREDEER
jgi:hypothetical protein